MKYRNIALPVIFAAMLLLAGCGGGGGGGSSGNTTPVTMQPVVDEPNVPPVVDEPNMPPVVDEPNSGGIPDSLIPNAGLGSKDPYYMPGGGFGSDVLLSTSSEYPTGIPAFGKRIVGPTIGDWTLVVPNAPLDVRTAWNDGWTGQGVNILIADSFGTVGRDDGGTHGYTVGMSALEIARRANFYGLEAGLDTDDPYVRGILRNSDNIAEPANTPIHVINMSFGDETPLDANISPEDFAAAVELRGSDPLYNDILGDDYLTGTDDAVVVKAAGNGVRINDVSVGIDSFRDTGNSLLVFSDVTDDRILIVGALNTYAQYGGARLAGYSNFAGILPEIQNRFLVEYGGSPYGERAYLCDLSSDENECESEQFVEDTEVQGTSFAAPRVAGHAALVRHKFPGLSAPQTTQILLQTATYEGLTCNSTSAGCSEYTYGQGRVHIADALSPIGKLR